MLLFTRHGAKDPKYKGIWTGQIDVDLSKNGVKQASELGKQLQTQKIIPNVVISSTMKRGVATAKAIVKQLTPKPKLESNIEFIEMTHGDVDGLNEKQFVSRYPEILKAWDNNEDYRFPNGENFEDVEKRSMPKLRELLKTYKGKKILFVGHKSINMVLIGALLHINYPFRYIPQQDVCNLTLFIIGDEIKLKFLNINPKEIKNYKLSGYIE
jgi:broad specificity phosphatase PhoE